MVEKYDVAFSDNRESTSEADKCVPIPGCSGFQTSLARSLTCNIRGRGTEEERNTEAVSGKNVRWEYNDSSCPTNFLHTQEVGTSTERCRSKRIDLGRGAS